jgi:hypothetical protein
VIVLASGEISVAGYQHGTYVDTHLDDGVEEKIQEELITTGGRTSRVSLAEQKWIFDVPPGGTAITVLIEARRRHSCDCTPPDPEFEEPEEDFNIEWSTDDVNYQPLFVVDSVSSVLQTASLTAGTSGTVFIRAVDTDRTPGSPYAMHSNGAAAVDALWVDYLVIRVVQ